MAQTYTGKVQNGVVAGVRSEIGAEDGRRPEVVEIA